MTKTQIAVNQNRTLFRKSIKNPMENKSPILKSGEANKKLGGFVTKGIWRGLPLYSLTLEERKTCPKTCIHFADCYGNNMPFANRFKSGGDLIQRLEIELKRLNHIHPFGFVIRLHVLGDFYNVEYVQQWAKWLQKYPNMKVFGYTAYNPKDNNKTYSKIGAEIVKTRNKYLGRFQIRLSNGGNTEFSANSINDGFDGFTCPEQLKKVPSCAECGLCWTTKKSVNFITH